MQSLNLINGNIITLDDENPVISSLSINDGKIVEKNGKIDTMKFEMPDDPKIMKLIEEYEKTTGRMNRNKQKMMKAKN